ncbi:MAG TPA: hypothetical protein VKB38_11160 [Terracidiphilus sp.]|nr:hypothetical protein [Terracidiphilus sp.]
MAWREAAGERHPGFGPKGGHLDAGKIILLQLYLLQAFDRLKNDKMP